MAGFSLQPDSGLALSVAVVSVTATSTAIISGSANQFIKVYKLFLVENTPAVTIKFTDGTNDLCGALPLSANGAITLDLDGTPWFTCPANTSFTLVQSGTTQISGTVYYTKSPY